jgi:hypothetical protein
MRPVTLIPSLAGCIVALESLLAVAADPPPQTAAPEGKAPKLKSISYTLSGPYTHDNLTIFLFHGQDQLKQTALLTLHEAVAQKKAIVHETGSVNELAVENLSPTEDVLIQAGDIVKGGRQDRILAVDLILPRKSGDASAKLPIASFCCESGRWTNRGNEPSFTPFLHLLIRRVVGNTVQRQRLEAGGALEPKPTPGLGQRRAGPE